ncbi:hypothetical protein Nepgr_033440 [Nepenthes gracilis]|uniref:Reverse transcriptase/retrotransposon-derived protein RNase H-like domain-containing protein n=1 Tax=Nepenthes gracilis TaxID=150966 RepID=A0AAD3TM19_NEPGR|nr:hypothetical protein Nepgr_033440 [Nepenthes gracilis]
MLSLVNSFKLMRRRYEQLLSGKSLLPPSLKYTVFMDLPRSVIKNLSTGIIIPITNSLNEGDFRWANYATGSFNKLKRMLTKSLVLTLPDFSEVFTDECDTSHIVIGTVLSQHGWPVSFFSKNLNDCILYCHTSTSILEVLFNPQGTHFTLGP